ncbi:MAG: amino acid adenylation domain-containing protein, partial [Pseudomonadota bacterium]
MNSSNSQNQIENMYPLSPMQQGLLFHSLLAPRAGLYIPHIILDLQGALDSAALRDSWKTILQEQSVLRSGFFWEQRDKPFQIVFRNADLIWTEQDWRDKNTSEQISRLEAYLTASKQQGFDLNKPPLMRLALIRTDEDCYKLIFAYHHLVLDGWSAARLLEQTFSDVIARASGITPPTHPASQPFSDYVAWLNQQDHSKSENFWRSYIKPQVSPTNLPFSITDEYIQGFKPAKQELIFDIAETNSLRDFVRQQSTTLNTLMQGAFALLLASYNDTEFVTFGLTVSGRPASLPGADSMIGLFINSVPMQINLPPTETISNYLQKIQNQQTAAAEYEHVALHDLQNWINNGQALFDCLYVYEGYPSPSGLQNNSTISLNKIHFEEQTHFPLTLQVAEGEKLIIGARFNLLQFNETNIKRMLEHLRDIILMMVSDKNTQLHKVSSLTSTELKEFETQNSTYVDFPKYSSLIDWLEKQAASTPENLAVTQDDISIGYDELHKKANSIANYLNKYKINAEDMIAIFIPRSIPMITAIFAVLKTGATFLPLDTDQPIGRLQAIIDDAKPSLLLFDSETKSPPFEIQKSCKRIDLSQIDLKEMSKTAPKRAVYENNAIYTIYTSGSTGQPKGVVNTHRALINRLAWMQDHFELKSNDRVLQKTSVGFDVSIWEIFWPLLTGASLVLAAPGRHGDVKYLAELIKKINITTLHFVPPMLAAFLEEPDVNTCNSIKHIICSGEALSSALKDHCYEILPDCELYNLYGPTEAAIDVTSWRCLPGDTSVPIGKPISNINIRILDRNYNQVAIGIPGELYIGGVGLARCYYKDPVKTACAFLPDPFTSGKSHKVSENVLYRTGDLARWREDGAIEYLGRIDHQVKLNGVRIELGEIEAAMLSQPKVQNAVVVLRADHDEAKILVAYIVANNDEKDSLSKMQHTDWQNNLATILPAIMIPSSYVILDELPLTYNGKIDRKALRPPQTNLASEYVAPRNVTEEQIASIWCEVLKLQQVGI